MTYKIYAFQQQVAELHPYYPRDYSLRPREASSTMLSVQEILQSEYQKVMLLITVLLVQLISSLPSLTAAAAQVSYLKKRY